MTAKITVIAKTAAVLMMTSLIVRRAPPGCGDLLEGSVDVGRAGTSGGRLRVRGDALVVGEARLVGLLVAGKDGVV